MFGPWSTITSSESSEEPTKMVEVWERCTTCGGSGILIKESWEGKISYNKCPAECKEGKKLVDVVVQ